MNKKLLRKAAAVVTSAVFLLSASVCVSANKYNPAEAYANNITGSQSAASDPVAAETVSAPVQITRTVNNPATALNVYSFQSSVYVGDTFRIGYMLTPADSDDYVTYTSSDTKVISVDNQGKVTARSRGNAVISITTSTGIRERFTVYVKGDSAALDPSVPYIELERSNVDLDVGDTYMISYSVNPAEDYGTVTYRSLNTAVAAVAPDGMITAVGEGSTRVVCTTASGVYSAVEVNVYPSVDQDKVDKQYEDSADLQYNEFGELVPTRARFSEESASVKVGEKYKLSIKLYPSNCVYTYDVESSDPSVATVTRGGTVKGISQGSAVITFTTDNGVSDSINITVYDDVIKGIDISRHNGDINFKALKATGEANFAMIRASYGYEDEDIRLRQNVKGCEKYGIPYGFYHYTYATSVAEAKKEAAFFLNVISEYSPEYPIVLDIEEDKIYHEMSRDEVTAIVKTFMNAFEKAGYYAMIYSYARFFETNVYMGDLVDYDIWVACWGDQEKLSSSFSYNYGIWQYSETGKLDGIDEYVDLNYAYMDYAAVIKEYHLNGF